MNTLSKKYKMKKILPLLFFLSALSIKAQINVSGTCNETNVSPNGTYSIVSGVILNGRDVYTKDGLTDCGVYSTSASCVGGGGLGATRYRIFWSGSQWVLEATSCVWDSVAENCFIPNFGDGTVLASNNADTSLPPNGVWVSNAFSCNLTISGGALSIDDINASKPIISIHPNPSFGEITISFGEPVTNAIIKLIDIKGQTLLTKSLQATDRETIKLNQPAGLYFLTLILSDGKQYNYKLIKN